jgi:hypothetical protein
MATLNHGEQHAKAFSTQGDGQIRHTIAQDLQVSS